MTGLLGLGPTLGLGDPALRMVVGVRWAPQSRAAASSSPPLEALFVARSPSGAVLPLQLGGDLAGVPTRQTPAGETVALLPDTRPLRVRLGAPGHATWVETLALDGTSPVRIERVLPERSGEAHLALSVVDEEGRPVHEAPLLLDGVDLGEVCGTCGVSLEGLAEGGHALEAAEGQAAAVPQQVEAVDAKEARSATPPVFLQRPEGSVSVEVEDADGPRPDARVTVIQAMGEETLRLDAQGRAELVLPPGRYRVRVVAPGMGAQERSLSIEEGDSRLHAVSVLLLPAAEDGATLDLGLLTAEGTPLGGAAVRLGATLLGAFFLWRGWQTPCSLSTQTCSLMTNGAAMKWGRSGSRVSAGRTLRCARARARGSMTFGSPIKTSRPLPSKESSESVLCAWRCKTERRRIQPVACSLTG